MGFFQKAKETATRAGSAIAEKYRERYSQEPQYAYGRSIKYANQAEERKQKARVIEAEARIARARQQGGGGIFQRLAREITPPRDERRMVRVKGKKGKRIVEQPRDRYAHLFGTSQGPKNFDFITGGGSQKKKDPYAHLFGK